VVDKNAKDTHPNEPSGPTRGLRRSVMAEKLIQWLLAGDIAIQYQTRRVLRFYGFGAEKGVEMP